MSIAAPSPFAAVVIGGGISGLACAYRLQQAGIPARVLEAGARPGGLIATKEKDGFQFELGPQSFLSTEPLLQLIESLGLNDQLLHADRRAPRYILSGGKLVRAPLAPQSLLTTPLLGPTTKWKIFTEMTRHTAPPEGDESVAAFVRRKFGAELLEKLVAPFVSGVYAGDPEQLSLRASFPKLYVVREGIRQRDEGGDEIAGGQGKAACGAVFVSRGDGNAAAGDRGAAGESVAGGIERDRAATRQGQRKAVV